MLHIYFGKMQDAIYNTEVYFKNTYQEDWITGDFAREVIKGVDRSEVLDKHLIKSPVLGLIPPTFLSGGTKTLLLIKNCPDMVFNASTSIRCSTICLTSAELEHRVIYTSLEDSRVAPIRERNIKFNTELYVSAKDIYPQRVLFDICPLLRIPAVSLFFYWMRQNKLFMNL